MIKQRKCYQPDAFGKKKTDEEDRADRFASQGDWEENSVPETSRRHCNCPPEEVPLLNFQVSSVTAGKATDGPGEPNIEPVVFLPFQLT